MKHKNRKQKETKEKLKKNNSGEQKKTKVSKMIWRQPISTQEENGKKNEIRMSTQEYIDSAPSFNLKISQYFRDDL